MNWADYWEMLDGRIWIEMIRSGKAEKHEHSEELEETVQSLREEARRRGWING